MTAARTTGAIGVFAGLATLAAWGLGVWVFGLSAPVLLLVGLAIAGLGAYQVATNLGPGTPPEDVPSWWVPGAAATVATCLAFGVALLFWLRR